MKKHRRRTLGQFSPEDDRTQTCIAAGATASKSPWLKNRYLIFPSNVRGMVKESDFNAPHSELARHVRAAGRSIQAWQCDEDVKSCGIIFTKADGTCGYTDGLATEVLSHELRRVTQSIWGRKARTELSGRRRKPHC